VCDVQRVAARWASSSGTFRSRSRVRPCPCESESLAFSVSSIFLSRVLVFYLENKVLG
jgi:hypothetical protein